MKYRTIREKALSGKGECLFFVFDGSAEEPHG
jgi:hypothetical protein